MDNPPTLASKTTSSEGKNHCRRMASRELFGLDKRVEIHHGKEIYLLQITRHGKLILTK